MNWQFLTNWNEAAKHPNQTILTMFVLVGLTIGGFAYFTFAQHVILAAVAIGSGAGLLFALYTRSEIRSRSMQARPERRRSWVARSNLFDALLIGVGVLLAVLALVDREVGLLLSGVAFLGLGLILLLGRRRLHS